jgi:hypothetical protein
MAASGEAKATNDLSIRGKSAFHAMECPKKAYAFVSGEINIL